MGSKTLKTIKNQNKQMKGAMKTQKQKEENAKQALKKAKAEAGIFMSREERDNIKIAKMQYDKERTETKYGQELQKQGKRVQSCVNAKSSTMGIFHSDNKLDEKTKQHTAQHTQRVNTFLQQNPSDSNKKKSKSLKSMMQQESIVDKALGNMLGTSVSQQTNQKRDVPTILTDTLLGKDSDFSL